MARKRANHVLQCCHVQTFKCAFCHDAPFAQKRLVFPPPPPCSGWEQGCRFVFLSIQGVGREGLWVLILIGIDMAHSDLDGFCPPTLTTTTTHPTIAHLKLLEYLRTSRLQIPEPRQPRLTPFYSITADTLRPNRDCSLNDNYLKVQFIQRQFLEWQIPGCHPGPILLLTWMFDWLLLVLVVQYK